MPPHRDWTRRGAGRAMLYWPLVSFILVAAFPALAVPLVIGSGITLITIGLICGFAGKRWRARRLAQARQTVADLADPVLPGTGRDRDDDAASQAREHDPAVWPTGRHAPRPRRTDAPGATPEPASAEVAEEPARRDAA